MCLYRKETKPSSRFRSTEITASTSFYYSKEKKNVLSHVHTLVYYRLHHDALFSSAHVLSHTDKRWCSWTCTGSIYTESQSFITGWRHCQTLLSQFTLIRIVSSLSANSEGSISSPFCKQFAYSTTVTVGFSRHSNFLLWSKYKPGTFNWS